MEKQVTEALQNYRGGCTCSQSVLCAYSDIIGLDKTALYRLSEGFGGGFGGLQAVCRALSPVFAVISYCYSDGKLEGGKTKLDTYAKIREAAALFEKEFGSIVCREILHGGKPQPFKCGRKVRIAAETVNKVLEHNTDE
ncbi:MAG: C-GCAxxG-C-C family protein [Lachnospiraceae bacterium]|nr:C-GCAxxG-C-C family protein [Ruminococcus sp.]MCM1276354.1 C-GCAxxG-C-C family protein [Lachnospiraceae bacterium]